MLTALIDWSLRNRLSNLPAALGWSSSDDFLSALTSTSFPTPAVQVQITPVARWRRRRSEARSRLQ